MVLSVPKVSKCIINSKQDFALLGYSKPTNSKNKDDLIKLSNLLQVSLETDKILQLFFNYLRHYFKLTNLLFINKKLDISILLNDKITTIRSNKNNKKYELSYQEQYLGELSFNSKVKLTPNKTIELNEYINLLILPIKNSMLYSQALKETRTDPLTKTGNKLALFEGLKYHFNLSNRYNNPLAILFIDVDYFKNINDKYGHIIGDEVLKYLGCTLKSIIRKSDTVYRFGGEEFIIILEKTNQNGAINLAKKIKSYINKKDCLFNFNNHITKISITLSIGIAEKQLNDDCDSLIKKADGALYLAKNKGRNCFVIA